MTHSPDDVPDIDGQIAETSSPLEEVSDLDFGLSRQTLHQNTLHREDILEEEISRLRLFTIKWLGRAFILVVLLLGVSAAFVVGWHYLTSWEWLDPPKLGRITDFVSGALVFLAASGIWKRFSS